MHRYVITDETGDQYSADPRDYWYNADNAPMGQLVRLDHPWRTVTGRTVIAPRLVKENATMRDLRRLAR